MFRQHPVCGNKDARNREEPRSVSPLYPSSLARSAGFVSLAEKASLVSISRTFLFLWDRVLLYRWSSNFLEKVALKRERWWLRCHLVPTLCSSRKYPYPSPHEGQRIFRGEQGSKRMQFPRGWGVAS